MLAFFCASEPDRHGDTWNTETVPRFSLNPQSSERGPAHALADMVRLSSWLVWPVLLVAIQLLFFPAPAASMLSGVILGLITALVALGMYLVFRANRVINFAAGEMGLLPAVLSLMLLVESGWPWYLAFPAGLLAAAALGVVAEFLLIRRFFDSPRLVVTVATFGVASLLALIAFFMPAWWDSKLQSQRIAPPWDISFTVGTRPFHSNHILALLLAPLAIVAVGALLRYTRLGIAVRAAAELPSRAAMLGIPVKGLQGVVWGLATTLGFLAIFLRAGIYGIPVGGQLGLLLFLRSLAALTLGRMEHLPTIIGTSIGLGILQEGIVWNSGAITADAKMGAITGVVIVIALLTRRDRGLRSEIDTSSWQSTSETRPIPEIFAKIPLVRIGRGIGICAFASAIFALPYVGWIFDTSVILRFGEIYMFAIVFVSLGVLTGWAGQLSLGQLAFSLLGGAVAGTLTMRYDVDIILAVGVAGIAGALASLVIGIPALRLRGAYLAVTTLAFGVTMSQYFLNPRFFDWVPAQGERIARNPILGVIDWSSSRAIYYVCLVTMLLAFAAVRGIRNSRTGRVLIALRDNEAATEAYGVSPLRAKLTAFAIAGFLTAAAGAVYTHHQQAFFVWDPGFSIGIFAGAVIGGLGTAGGAFLGALYFNGSFFWLKGNWFLFATGVGILVVLLVAPRGLIGFWYDTRDLAVRALARRRGITESDIADQALAAREDSPDGGVPT